MDFSKNLRTLRKAAGLSQERLAETLNVSRQTVSKWETGEARPLTEHIFALARVLNCSLGDLLGETPGKSTKIPASAPQIAAPEPSYPRLRLWALGAMTAATLIGLVAATNLCANTRPTGAPFDFSSQELLGYGIDSETGSPYLKFALTDPATVASASSEPRVAIVYLCPDGSYRCDYPDDPDFLPAGEFHPAES